MGVLGTINDLWRPEPSDLPPKPKKGALAAAMAESRTKLANKAARDAGFAGIVQKTTEFSRIMEVPRRVLDLEAVTDITSIFRKEGGSMVLRPIQSASLIEAHIANGFFGPIGVGWGKTLILLLMAEAMDSEKAVLLVPPQLRDQLNREIDEVYGRHFNLPLDRVARIVAYSELSLAKNAELLDELNPDLIVADEIQNLKRAASTRTKRFLRYMRENPHCRFCGMSGTVTNRSVKDYAHLIELALRKNSPLPNGYQELLDWSGALDVKPAKLMLPGVLDQFCEGEENVRQGYRRRLVETLGVVATVESALGTSLLVRNVRPDTVPADVVAALAEVTERWAYNGEEYSDPLSLWRFHRQMACGFYYRWVWPDDKPDDEWLEGRAAWKKAAREKVKQNRKGMDSEFLVASAAERWRRSIEDHSYCEGVFEGDDHSECTHSYAEMTEDDLTGYDDRVGDEMKVIHCKVNPKKPDDCTGKGPKFVPTKCKVHPGHLDLCTGVEPKKYGPNVNLWECEEWIAWKKLKTRYNPTPPKEAVWISDFLIEDVIERAKKLLKKDRRIIIWYHHACLGKRIAEQSGWPHFGQGTDASTSTDDVIICSVATQGTGKNLQHFNHNIVTTLPTNGQECEQLLGRTHRPGNEDDCVTTDYFDHTESLDQHMTDVIADAMYVEDSTGQRQKILYADGERIRHKKQMLLDAQKLELEQEKKEREEKNGNQLRTSYKPRLR